MDKLTHFRVHDYASGFSSGRSSYFHKTIGGYHGAKLKKYQEVWSFYFDPESKYLNPYTGQKVLNMLNTRYIMGIPQGQQVRMAQPNPGALGNAWLVKDVKYVQNADEEILALGDSTWNPATTAITQTKNEGLIGQNGFSGVGNVALESYHPTKMVYSFNSQEDQLVVFSEVFYPKYWNVAIDGQAAEIINVNYILRAIKVPAGKHEIIMSYDNPKIDKYNSISKVGSSIFYVFFFGMIFLLYRDSSKQPKLEEKKTDSNKNE